MLIYFDGGCRPNPGEMSYAYVIETDEGVVEERYWSGGAGTNNLAEWTALLASVKAAIAFEAPKLIFRGDSQLVVNGMTGRWKVNIPAFAKIRTQIAKSLAGRTAQFEYVPRAKNLAGILIEAEYKKEKAR